MISSVVFKLLAILRFWMTSKLIVNYLKFGLGIFSSLIFVCGNALALETRAICGDTVSSATYTGVIPNWLDGTAVVYDSSSTLPLGLVSSNAYSAESILNSYGTYGSSYSTNSIFNTFGTYGSPYSSNSVCNTFALASNVPKIWRNGVLIGYLTKNQFITGAIDPATLIAALLKQGFGGSMVSDLTAPTVPNGFTGQVVSSTQINFSWNASSDNVGVVSYILYSGNNIVNVLAPSPTGLALTGLSPATTYNFSLAACDASSNCSSRSSSVNITTPASTGTTTQATLVVTSNPSSINVNGTSNLGTTGGSGSGNVSYTVVSGPCTLNMATLIGTAAGSCIVTASKASDSTYASATSSQLTVNVTLGAVPTPTLTFATPTSASVTMLGSLSNAVTSS